MKHNKISHLKNAAHRENSSEYSDIITSEQYCRAKNASMTMVEHLIELKTRLWYSIICLIAMFGVCYFFADQICAFIAEPLLKHEAKVKIIYTALPETFFTYIKLASLCACGLSIPFWMLQLYLFMAPGLYKKEAIFIITIFVSFLTMFCIGCATLYYGILPLAIDFLISYQDNVKMPIALYAKISEYITMITYLVISFGLAFQLPVILISLCKINVIHYKDLQKFRRFAIVIIFVIAAIATPPDITSQIFLASVMLVLYEITILICKYIVRNYKNETYRL